MKTTPKLIVAALVCTLAEKQTIHPPQ